MAGSLGGCSGSLNVRDEAAQAATIVRTGDSPSNQQQAATPGGDTAEVPEMSTKPPVPDAAKISSTLQVMIQHLLAQAGYALESGRLTSPESDNAFDKYQAVLLVDPNNLEARAGLEAVLQRYVIHINMALDSENIGQANRYLKVAKATFPGEPIFRELTDKSERLRQVLAARHQIPVSQSVEGLTDIKLPVHALASRSPELIQLLAKASRRLEATDESVLIYARSDAEGRWIYQTMKSFVPDYLIRGDIQLRNQPALVFLEPIE